MQDRYVGDVGDFGKYGLLRSLATNFSLGIVWYLVPDESHNADGGFVSYLEPTAKNIIRFRECDPNLYDALAKIVQSETRSVRNVQEHRILPSNTLFYDAQLTYQGISTIGPSAKVARLAHRRRWVEGALDATQECDIIFLDPDNGLESRTQRHVKSGPKFVYLDDIQRYLDRGQSVIVYHHQNRTAKVPDQIQQQLGRLQERLDGHGHIYALLFQRFSLRTYFVISAPVHEPYLDLSIRRFMDSPWAQHFCDMSLKADDNAT